MSGDLDRVPLKVAIAGLRQQIQEAAQQAEALQPGELKFRITEIELELTVAAEDSATTGGELGWWIFKARADVAAKDIATHKVKLKLDVEDIEVGSSHRTR
jgi:hypothetical protein